MKFTKIVLVILTIYSGQLLFAMSIEDVRCDSFRQFGSAIASKVIYVALAYTVKISDVLDEGDKITFRVIYPNENNSDKNKPIKELQYKVLRKDPQTGEVEKNPTPVTFEPAQNYIFDDKGVGEGIDQYAPRLLSPKEHKEIIELVNEYFFKRGHYTPVIAYE